MWFVDCGGVVVGHWVVLLRVWFVLPLRCRVVLCVVVVGCYCVLVLSVGVVVGVC